MGHLAESMDASVGSARSVDARRCPGFRAGAVSAGIKGDTPDLALVVCDVPAAVAGVFTTNKIQAAPVKLDRDRVATGVYIYKITAASSATDEVVQSYGKVVLVN